MELFQKDNSYSYKEKIRPLSWRMMPEDIGDFVGQAELLGENGVLRRLIEEDKLVSLIFYGPPGTGKTALARIIAKKTNAQFIALNAVTSGIRDIREAVAFAKKERTILFVDEIHRFNKIQQDALLPHVEEGEVVLIGASTENPFFALVPALASRSMIFEFKPLSQSEIRTIILKAINSPKGLGGKDVEIQEDAIKFMALQCSGDARKALNTLELSYMIASERSSGRTVITKDIVKEALQNKTAYYSEDEHYDVISAFIKSMRGSDPDAALYWLARMLTSGEDPMFIARRIVICASEDVGNADPMALQIAVAAMHAVEKIGMPEARIPLSQATIYVATAPKSNASYLAIERAINDVQNEPLQSVPGHLKDSHYSGAKRLGRGEGYLYPHNYEGHYVKQRYLEKDKTFYEPSDEGFERNIKILMKKRRNIKR